MWQKRQKGPKWHGPQGMTRNIKRTKTRITLDGVSAAVILTTRRDHSNAGLRRKSGAKQRNWSDDMASRAEPREIDFGQCGDWEHRVFVNALPRKATYTERPLVDLSGVNPLVLQHVQTVASRVREHGGYKSQFVEVTQPFHRHLGADADGVLDRVWREAKGVTVAYPKDRPVADDADNARPRVWKATDLESSKPKTWLAKHRIPRSGVTVLVGDEGIGKSLLWVWIVGAVTTGKPLPEFGIPARDPQHVRLILTEDDWSTEVRPRLEVRRRGPRLCDRHRHGQGWVRRPGVSVRRYGPALRGPSAGLGDR